MRTSASVLRPRTRVAREIWWRLPLISIQRRVFEEGSPVPGSRVTGAYPGGPEGMGGGAAGCGG